MLSAEPDGTNINDHCGSTHMEQLMAYVPAHGCQLGLAFDGDADLCLAVDETGKVVDGDQMIAICAKALKASGKLEKDTAVVTVMTNLGFFHFTKREGIHAVATTVGDRYVLEEMRAKGYAIGGEQSGHVILLHHSTTGDGALTAGKVLALLARKKCKMSQLNSCFDKFPQVLINVAVPHSGGVKEKIMASEALAEAVAAEEAALNGEGRVLVRPSGTEALIRVMVEAKTTEIAQTVAQRLADFIKSLKF